MRALRLACLAVLFLFGCDSDEPGGDAGDAMDAGSSSCEPDCRDGFTCVRGACVSACNPPCGAGERCTGAGECVLDSDGGDRTDAGPVDGGDLDAAAGDGGASPDASADAGRTSMPCTAMGVCDPFDPSACPSGQKCRVTAMGTACADLTESPPLGAGAECALDTDCAPTLWCVSFGTTFECTPMCPNGSIGACGPDSACIGTVGMEECVRACRPIPARCDIYAQDCAASGDMCTLATNPESGENYTGCRPNGTLALGEACGGDLGRCARGLICIREGMASTCRAVCGPDGAPPTCATGACTGLARSWGVPYCRG